MTTLGVAELFFFQTKSYRPQVFDAIIFSRNKNKYPIANITLRVLLDIGYLFFIMRKIYNIRCLSHRPAVTDSKIIFFFNLDTVYCVCSFWWLKKVVWCIQNPNALYVKWTRNFNSANSVFLTCKNHIVHCSSLEHHIYQFFIYSDL